MDRKRGGEGESSLGAGLARALLYLLTCPGLPGLTD